MEVESVTAHLVWVTGKLAVIPVRAMDWRGGTERRRPCCRRRSRVYFFGPHTQSMLSSLNVFGCTATQFAASFTSPLPV